MEPKDNKPGTNYWKRGEPFVWISGAALSVSLMIVVGLVIITLVNGLGYFWPHTLTEVALKDGRKILGVQKQEEVLPANQIDRVQFHQGNRDLYGVDFIWIDRKDIEGQTQPLQAIALERMEYGAFFGYLKEIKTEGLDVAPASTLFGQLQNGLAAIEPIQEHKKDLEEQMAQLSYRKESLRLRILKLRYKGVSPDSSKIFQAREAQQAIEEQFNKLNQQAAEQGRLLNRYCATLATADGKTKTIGLDQIVRAYQPNTMSLSSKCLFYGGKIVELLTEDPREANTEGGLFPAIFGTVAMVFLMSLFCIPMGVVAAVYLREYAKEGLAVQLVRIAVNNLAGVPSIVYGVFGLGFFVYGLGHMIDKIFFPERLPTPTFGTGGILWASLTLALLTVPVVIVATEEALAAIPRGMREGSLALGATKFQTLVRILLPMASPGIMTGLILAMARAAGEVAPLMIVGVVKLAPTLPVDGTFPLLHLNRKFMHLGFHIYDVGFQSPNVEAAKPMVYVTTLLLVGIVILMSALAIYLRNSMRKKFTAGVF